MKHKDITSKIIECAYKVHNSLGFGFLENVYQNAFMIELKKAGLQAQKEVPIKIFYEDITPIERKSRMPQIQGIKGDAVVYYRKPLITP